MKHSQSFLLALASSLVACSIGRPTERGGAQEVHDNSFIWQDNALRAPAGTFPQATLASPTIAPDGQTDPCALIAGKRYVAPAQARACLRSFPFNETLRDNIVDVLSKTFNFHTSTNYQIQAPDPFADTHVDIQAELRRIKETDYSCDFDLHFDLYKTVRRLNDGHAGYLNYCYDSLYVTYLPFPLVLLNDEHAPDVQAIYVAPEAFEVASGEFVDEIGSWQALSGLDFSTYSGAKVVAIDDRDPWDVIEDSVNFVGGYQSRATRQNSFFSSYQRATNEWSYRMGDFAQLPHPIKDTVKLTVIPPGRASSESIVIPYRSRFNAASVPFTSGQDLWEKNCLAKRDTNGVNIYPPSSLVNAGPVEIPDSSAARKGFAIPVNPEDRRRPVSALVDDGPLFDVSLPKRLTPGGSLSGSGAAHFYLHNDGERKTGILALGSFSGNYTTLFTTLKDGLQGLKDAGASHLIVDVTNNGGGFICVAHWLHRLLAGPGPLSEPQAGLDTRARAQDVAQAIVKKIVAGADPKLQLLYNPTNWAFANHTTLFPADYDWLDPAVPEKINGRDDRFSQRIGQECQPFPIEPFEEQPFSIDQIAIVTNGRCASSCSLFSISMKVKYNTKMVVVGGKQGVTQQYCGVVGGQSTNFATIDTEIKSTGLKDHVLAPPDFITDSYQGITWRLGFHPNGPQMEEWMNHPADFSFPLTQRTVNNPAELWKNISKRLWP